MEYYKLPFCRPDKVETMPENLGEILVGDIIETTGYEINMLQSKTCAVLCRKEYSKEEAQMFISKILDEYSINLLMDNLPAATQVPIQNTDQTVIVYEHGYRVGGTIIEEVAEGEEPQPNAHFLYNHIRITVSYHDSSSGEYKGSRIVGLEVEPFSVNHKYEGEWDDAEPAPPCARRSSSTTLTGTTRPRLTAGPR